MNPKSLHRILISFRPSTGTSLGKLPCYGFDRLFLKGGKVEFQRFFEAQSRLIQSISYRIDAKRRAGYGVRTVFFPDNLRLHIPELDGHPSLNLEFALLRFRRFESGHSISRFETEPPGGRSSNLYPQR